MKPINPWYLLIYASVVGLIILLSSFFGFDVTDEGYLMLVSSPAQSLSGVPLYYLKALTWISEFLPIGIVEMRILRLLIHFVALAAFVRALKSVWQSLAWTWTQTHSAAIILFSFSAFLYFPNSLSYNALSFSIGQFITGLLLFYYFCGATQTKTRQTLLSVVLAVFVLLLYYVKISSALCFIALTVMVYLAESAINKRGAGFWALLSFALSLMILMMSIEWFIPEYAPSRLLETIATAERVQTTHSRGLLIKNFAHLIYLLSLAGLSGILMASNRFYLRYLGWPLALAVLAFGFGWAVDKAVWRFSHYAGVIFTVYLAWLVAKTWPQVRANASSLLLMAGILFAGNFSVFLGTNNHNLVMFSMCLGIVAPLLMALQAYAKKAIRLDLLLSVAVSALVLYQLVFSPYRMAPLYQQTVSVETSVGLDIHLTAQSAQEISRLRADMSALGMEKGDPIFGFFKFPGLIYLLEGYSPGGIVWSELHMPSYLEFLKNDKPLDCAPCYLIATEERYALDFMSQLGARPAEVIAVSGRFRIYELHGQIEQGRLTE